MKQEDKYLMAMTFVAALPWLVILAVTLIWWAAK
jgi:hypothetical protein